MKSKSAKVLTVSFINTVHLIRNAVSEAPDNARMAHSTVKNNTVNRYFLV